MTDAQQTAPVSSPWLVAFAVSLATFMEVLDTTITNVSLTHISGSLGSSQDESTWVLTSYLVANGIILPLSGWLSSVFGRKTYFLGCIVAFTAASFACGAATSLPMLIFFRVIQGLAGGGLQPTQQAIIVDAFPPHKRGSAFAITGITMIVAPILGPTLGGYITDSFSWRWIFYLNVPVGALAFWLVSMFVRDPDHASKQVSSKIDYIGLSLVALGLGALQILLDKGQQEDWFSSHYIVTLAVISGACLVSAVLWILRQKDPIVNFRLMKDRGFGFSCLMIFFTGFALYGSSALLPMLVQTQFGYDATLSGLVLSPGGLVVVFLMPLVGRLVGRVPSKYLVTTGFLLIAFGMHMTSTITPESDYKMFAFVRITQVLGLPFLFIPISTIAFMKVAKEQSSKASALYSLFRNLGGSVGIALVATYVNRHQQVHQNDLVSHFSNSSPVYQSLFDRTVQALHTAGNPPAIAEHMATSKIYFEILHQVSILGYMDGFILLMWLLGLMAVLSFFLLPKNNPKAHASAEAPAGH